MKKHHVLYSILVFCLLFAGQIPPAPATTVLTGESEGMQFRVEEVARDLGIAWGMAFLSPSEIIFTQRDGQIGILDPATGTVVFLQGEIPRVRRGGQGGMLDVAVPEGYRAGDWIYFTYSREQNGRGVTTLARARRDNDRLKDWQDLVITQSATDRNIHYGSRIAFDNTGHIFLTVGDRGFRPGAQDLSTHAGAILRVLPDGSVPKDNPFVNVEAALPEIYSFGHRNPQGIVFDAATNRLWCIEHGPRGGDEINLVRAGRNYGWPVISYGREYWGPIRVGEGTEKEGMEQPVKYYTPSIAPGSLILYTGQAFPKWQGNLMSGALKLEHLNRVVLDASGMPVREERLLGDLKGRIRALAQSPEGWIYLSIDSGLIFRLRPQGPSE